MKGNMNVRFFTFNECVCEVVACVCVRGGGMRVSRVFRVRFSLTSICKDMYVTWGEKLDGEGCKVFKRTVAVLPNSE